MPEEKKPICSKCHKEPAQWVCGNKDCDWSACIFCTVIHTHGVPVRLETKKCPKCGSDTINLDDLKPSKE